MEHETTRNARPTFLTILCILSFIGLGSAIVNHLFTLAFSTIGMSVYNLVQTNLELALNEASLSDPAAAALLENIFDAVLKLISALPLFAGLGLICSGIALAGVILMWNLKKIGFYLYSGAKVLLIFIPFILIGYNFLSLIISMSMLVTAAIFITLYAFNLKAMK